MKAGKKATVELPGVLKVAPPPRATDRIYTGIAGFTRTHNLRPAEITTDKKRTGNTCSTAELLRRVCTRPILEPEAGLEPATKRLGGDNPILRPVGNGLKSMGWTRDGFDVSGRESNPHLLVFTRCSDAVELPSSITEAQRPIQKERRTRGEMGIHQLPDGAGFEPARGFPLHR